MFELQIDEGRAYLHAKQYNTVLFDSEVAMEYYLHVCLPPGTRYRLRGETKWREEVSGGNIPDGAG